ncbi:tolloid-like protein 1 [Ptychodera flava]|uniref:tolloid-like protein 1 n=1 Tax=Ptychodera flava TaxID=63121 RepID=UPI003969FD93
MLEEKDCGYDVSVAPGESVIVHSPNYPKNYSDNVNCFWTIANKYGGSIRLVFDSFETEELYDYVQYGTGYVPNADTYKHHGNVTPEALTSTESVWITFYSDRSVTSRGFKFVASAFGECKYEYQLNQADEITIASPNYPYNYHDNIECTWIIITNTVWGKIGLFFNSFDTESHYDTVGFGSGTTPDDDTDLYHGDEIPENYTSTGGEVWIVFYSDEDVVSKGFQLTAFVIVLEIPCNIDEYKCNDGTCIPVSNVCNLHQDCSYREDERDCAGEDVNLALGKPAFQSTDFQEHRKAILGVDGVIAVSDIIKCSHTHEEPEPWFKVDLEKSYRVLRIHLFNRQDYFGYRMLGARLRVGKHENYLRNAVCGLPAFVAVNQPPKMQYDAALACESYNMAIVKDGSVEKNEKLKEFDYNLGGFWLDGRLTLNGQDYESSDGKAITWTNFRPYEPNKDGRCLTMSWHNGYKWGDLKCESSLMYICEATDKFDCAVRTFTSRCDHICEHDLGSLLCICDDNTTSSPGITCADVDRCAFGGVEESPCDNVCVDETASTDCRCQAQNKNRGCLIYLSKCGFDGVFDLTVRDIGLVSYQFSRRERCQWTVKVPKGSTIKVVIEYYSIVGECAPPRCDIDVLEVYDKSDSGDDKLAAVCGDATQPQECPECPITNMGKAVIDAVLQEGQTVSVEDMQGAFTLPIQPMLKNYCDDGDCSECGSPRTLTTTTGSIYTTNYLTGDLYYYPDTFCKWTIVAPPGQYIRVRFDSFDVPSGHIGVGQRHCASYVALYNGSDVNDVDLMDKFCGSHIPLLSSLSNELTIVFSSDQTTSGTGFTATYQTGGPD